MNTIIKIISLLILIIKISNHPKGDDLRKLTLESDSGVIVFTPKMLQEYIMTHPRPYDVAMLFTHKKKCRICERVTGEFEKAAKSYKEASAFKPDMVTHKRAVFFGIFYYTDETFKIFKKLKFSSTTTILYTTPKNIQMDDKGEPYINYDEDYVISYTEYSEKVYALKMVEFTNAKSQRKIDLRKDPIEFLGYFIGFVLFLFVCFFMYKHFQYLLLSPKLWLFGSFMVYIICIGGIVYNILHGTPFAKFDRDGSIVEFVHTGQRSQYIGEGLMMSTIFVIGGTLFYAFNWINRIKGYWPHKIASLLLIFSLIIVLIVIIRVYRIKARWYSPNFFPPSHYVKGPLINDQGNSF